MRIFTLKRQMLFAMFVVFGCLAIHAADDDLITKQIIVKLDEAGTLPGKIGSSKIYKITNLKIVGKINGTDLQLIRDMAGCDFYGSSTNGKLAILDLTEAKIESGGDAYYVSYSCRTMDDELGDYAFYGCKSLTSLFLPSSIISIGYYAFEDCSSLTSLSVPFGVTSIRDRAFSGCKSLTGLSLPSGITSIGDYAFWGCSSLIRLSLPCSVTSIGNSAFEGCSGLVSLSIPIGVTSISDYAFSDCKSLTSFSLPVSVSSIGNGAFLGCSSLTSLVFPSSVVSIANFAFEGCKGLTSLYVYAEKLPKMGTDVFGGCDAKQCILYVPKGTYDDYWLSEFGYFENIVEFDVAGIDQVTTSTDAKEISRYTVNGQRLSAPTKGLNIVKYSDGSVKKVVVQ